MAAISINPYSTGIALLILYAREGARRAVLERLPDGAPSGASTSPRQAHAGKRS